MSCETYSRCLRRYIDVIGGQPGFAQEDKEKTKVETKANGDYKEKTKVKDENSKYREKTKVKSHHEKQSSGSCPKSVIEGEGPDHLIGQQP